MNKVRDVYKIAVLRSNAIGDFIFSLPAFEALRQAYPYAEIVLMGLDWHAEFLKNRPGPIDRVQVIPSITGLSCTSGCEDPQAVAAFFDHMQAEAFDLALQMHGGGKFSNPFVRRLGARLTAGARTNDADPLDRSIPYIFYQPEILRYLEIAALVGAEPVVLEPVLQVTPQDLDEAARLVPPSAQPLVVLHPGAGDPRRRWPIESFAAAGSALAWAGSRVVITGSQDDCYLGDLLADQITTPVFNLAGQLSLSGLAGLLSRASVVISNDSGPLHIAAAVGAPTVGIYWCGNLLTAGPLTRTRHRPAISWQLDCPACGQDCTQGSCDHRDSFVAQVPTTEVIASAFELLEMKEVV